MLRSVDWLLTTFRDNLSVIVSKGQAVPPTGCPERSVTNYQAAQRNLQEDRISHLHRGEG